MVAGERVGEHLVGRQGRCASATASPEQAESEPSGSPAKCMISARRASRRDAQLAAPRCRTAVERLAQQLGSASGRPRRPRSSARRSGSRPARAGCWSAPRASAAAVDERRPRRRGWPARMSASRRAASSSSVSGPCGSLDSRQSGRARARAPAGVAASSQASDAGRPVGRLARVAEGGLGARASGAPRRSGRLSSAAFGPQLGAGGSRASGRRAGAGAPAPRGARARRRASGGSARARRTAGRARSTAASRRAATARSSTSTATSSRTKPPRWSERGHGKLTPSDGREARAPRCAWGRRGGPRGARTTSRTPAGTTSSSRSSAGSQRLARGRTAFPPVQLVQPVGDAQAPGADALRGLDQLAGLAARRARSRVDARSSELLAADVGDHVGQRRSRASTSDVAVGAERPRRRRGVGGAREVPEEQQRRPVGPVQVVEDEHERARRPPRAPAWSPRPRRAGSARRLGQAARTARASAGMLAAQLRARAGRAPRARSRRLSPSWSTVPVRERSARSSPRTAGRAPAPPRRSGRRARSRPALVRLAGESRRRGSSCRCRARRPASTKRRSPAAAAASRRRSSARRRALATRRRARGALQRRGKRAASGELPRRAASPVSASTCSWSCAQLGRRRGAELLAQQHAQLLERLERLGLVAARGVRPHQQRVAGLAERRQIHELAGGQLRAQRSVAAQGERRLGQQLERLEPLLLLPAPVAPRARARRRSARARTRRCRARPRPPSAASSGSRRPAPRELPSSDAAAWSTSIGASAGSSSWSSTGPAAARRPSAAPQARQQRAQRGRRVARGAARPERVHQLVARDGAMAVEGEVGQQGAPQAPGKPALEAAAAHLESQLAAEVDPHRWPQPA